MLNIVVALLCRDLVQLEQEGFSKEMSLYL